MGLVDSSICKKSRPRYFKFVDDFPMTVTGKVRKVAMREQSIEELDLTAAIAQTA